MTILLSILGGLSFAALAGGLAGIIVNWVSVLRGRAEQRAREALAENEIDAEVARLCEQVEEEIRSKQNG